MKRSSLWLITALMTLALIGVFVMQLYYIRQAYRLKSQLFDQNVNKALNNIATKVQRRNAVVHIEKRDKEIKKQKESNIRSQTDKIVAFKENFKQTEDFRKFKQQQYKADYILSQISAINKEYYTPLVVLEDEYQTYYNTNKDVLIGLGIEVKNIYANNVVVQRRLVSKGIPRTLEYYNGRLPDTLRFLGIDKQDLYPRFISLAMNDKDIDTKFKIEDANAAKKYSMELERLYADTVVVSNDDINYLKDVQKEMQQADIPISKRISKKTLDTLIQQEMQNSRLPGNYEYWVKSAKKDSMIYIQASNPAPRTPEGDIYTVALFSNDVIRDPGILSVRFPNQGAAIFSEMGITLGSSLGFLLLLVFIFTYTIYSIIRQKKISEMKTDFINNMTHEFKTPVATIMLASEALKDPDVYSDKARISRLAGIIYDENVRLGNHIERVLSIARIENKELKLEQNPVNLNDLVIAVVDSMNLQLQKKNAKVVLNLEATEPNIVSDELHLGNVVLNLLDNANKYSRDNPVITITTRNSAKKLILEVKDEGIGMTKDQTKRIFDQFYRVPTGNLHDVKGFGLGLNYVQDIVSQMGATVKVHSEKDKGTVFEIAFPINHA